MSKLGNFFHRLGLAVAAFTEPPAPVTEPKSEPPMDAGEYYRALAEGREVPKNPRFIVRAPQIMPGVAPVEHIMAMDACNADSFSFANSLYDTQVSEAFSNLGFIGYPILAQLSTQSEYRNMCERPGDECTRKWIKFKSKSNTDKTERIKTIEAAMVRMGIRDLFRDADNWDNQFGRAQLFIQLKDETPEELTTPIFLDPRKITRGSLLGFTLIDPMTTYPFAYNATDPKDRNYYRPTSWYVMAQKVHASRLLTFVSRPLPPMLRPAYNFGGVPLAQMAMPAVNNWLVTRDNVNKVIQNFRTTALGTEMGDALAGGSGRKAIARAKSFVVGRDNQGLFLYDKNKEELKEINTTLASLDKLQAQAQEHMAAPSNMPLVVLLGITPTGLNASSEGEIAVWYDYIANRQEKLHRPHLEVVQKLIQLSELGDIDEDIDFDFVTLHQLSDEAKARIRKSTSDSDAQYVAVGAVEPLEVRKKLASDPDSGYSNLNLNEAVPPPNPALVKAEDPKLASIQAGLTDPGQGEESGVQPAPGSVQ